MCKLNLVEFLKDMADGIRGKKGTTDPINAQDMRSEWEALCGHEFTFTLPVCGVTSSDVRFDYDEETVIYGHTGSITIDGTTVGTPTISSSNYWNTYNSISVSGNVISYTIYGSNNPNDVLSAEITFTVKK